MARAPSAGSRAGGELESLLGRARFVALQRILITRAVRWASDVAPGSVHVAYEPAGAAVETRALVGPDVSVFAQNGAGTSGRLANAGIFALAGGGGPLMI